MFVQWIILSIAASSAVCRMNSFAGCFAGTYSSPIANVGARFGTMVGGLTTGRMLIGQGAIDACKIGESSCNVLQRSGDHIIDDALYVRSKYS
jgi:hypothetical protein